MRGSYLVAPAPARRFKISRAPEPQTKIAGETLKRCASSLICDLLRSR